MKLVFLALFLCLAVECQAQFGGFLWERFTTVAPWTYVPTTKKPRTRPIPVYTTTPRTTTTTTTTKKPTTNCKYNKNPKGKCTLGADGNYYITVKSTNGCPDKREECPDGQLLAQVFQDNFLSPPAQKKATAAAGGTGGGGGSVAVGGRTVTLGAKAPPPVPGTTTKPPPKPKCREVYRNGKLLFGGCTNPNEYVVPNRRKRSVQQTRRDLLIIMDESGSVGRTNYEKVKRIAAAIVRLLCEQTKYHKDFTRVSIMSFDQYYHFHVPLDHFYADADALANYIMTKIKFHTYSQGRTCMAKALRFGYQVMLSKALGGRAHIDDVEQDIILITDGCANCGGYGSIASTLATLSDEMKFRGIHVYVIGIGIERHRDNCKKHLQILAQGGRCFHFFYLDNWNYDVNNFLNQLENPPPGRCLPTFEHPLGQCLPAVGG